VRRGLVKRVTAFCMAETVLEKGPENACGETRFPCVLKHARDTLEGMSRLSLAKGRFT
jgi:hypothetical protein